MNDLFLVSMRCDKNNSDLRGQKKIMKKRARGTLFWLSSVSALMEATEDRSSVFLDTGKHCEACIDGAWCTWVLGRLTFWVEVLRTVPMSPDLPTSPLFSGLDVV